MLGTALGWVLWKVRKGHFLGEIPLQVRTCLRKSCAFALCTLGLGSLPIFSFRKLGWENIKPLYTEFLYRNIYTASLGLFGVIALVLLAIFYPVHQNKKIKYQLWASSCLSVGTALAPIVLTPRDILTTVSGYVLGLTVPAALSMAVSTNFLFLNLFSFISMFLSTLFMHSAAIPWIINRRHVSSGSVQVVPIHITSSLMLPFILGCSLVMMLHINLFVWHIKQSHEKKKMDIKAGVSSSIMHIDGTDEVTNGMIIACYVVYTWLKIWWEMMRLLKRSVSQLIRRGNQ